MSRTLLIVLFALLLPIRAAAAELTVFAAASLTDVLASLVDAWPGSARMQVRIATAASSTLARQIEAGAPADLFLSADRQWMDHLDAAGLLAPATRRVLAGNTLVIIAAEAAAIPAGTATTVLDALPTGERIAIGDPAHVPAGRYAYRALDALGRSELLHTRAALAADVRAALALVDRGEAPLGIVYATDVALSTRIRRVATLPPDQSHPVEYPAARLRDARHPSAADALLAFLSSESARTIWQRSGFSTPEAP
jgi:molybdate transport system substrate-binding protein